MAVKKSAGNVTTTYDSFAATAFTDNVTLSATVDPIEITDMADTAKTYIAGLGDWSQEISGPWDPTLDAKIGVDSVTPPSTLKTLVQVFDTVTYTATTITFPTSYSITAAPNDAIRYSATIKISGAPGRA